MSQSTPSTASVSNAAGGWLLSVLPGVLFCLIGAALAVFGNRQLPTISALLFAILLGAAVANLVSLPARLAPGIAVAGKKVLRLGIILLGLQLVLGDILALGWPMIAVVIAVVTLGILVTLAVGKTLGMSWTQRVLIGCGFSICGAAAVAAADGVVDADEDETATAVGLVVLFGTLMIPLVPLAASLMQMPQRVAGLWAGGSIHEVAQVVAAGGTIGPEALKVAVVVKLARVLMLAPVMALLAVQVRRTTTATDMKRPPVMPLFVAGFLVAVGIASLHLLDAHSLAVAKQLQTWLLATAMFALGLGVRFSTLAKVGPRPFVLGAIATLTVAGTALAGVALTNWWM